MNKEFPIWCIGILVIAIIILLIYCGDKNEDYKDCIDDCVMDNEFCLLAYPLNIYDVEECSDELYWCVEDCDT